jgi:hypothetical protein
LLKIVTELLLSRPHSSVKNMQDGSNAALKRITLPIAREEPQRAFTDALSEVSSLQMIQTSHHKRVVAYKGFYVETENFESTGNVHLCILLEYAAPAHASHCLRFPYDAGHADTALVSPCSIRST